MFERTTSGQQNRALFLGVDFVCYCEGDPGVGTEAAHDITFWAQVFASVRPDLKIHLVPRGGKPILERLSREVVDNNISNTLVVMDTDYDEITDDKIVDRRILYTFGYSWENDIFQLENLSLVYCALAHCLTCPQPVRHYLEQGLHSLEKQLRMPVKADYLALRGGTSVFPRDAPGRIVESSRITGLPSVRRLEVLKLCRQANSRSKPRAVVTGAENIDTLRYCFGHLFALAATYLMRSTVQIHRRKMSISSDHLQDVALQTFGRMLLTGGGSDMVQHHFTAGRAIA